MKLNDPFGRMERKREVEYEALRTTLRESGINNPEKARELIRDSRQRFYKNRWNRSRFFSTGSACVSPNLSCRPLLHAAYTGDVLQIPC